MPLSRLRDELPHGPLHLILAVATLVTLYPVFWVFSIAFSGKQSLAIADLPANPRVIDRLRAVIPWPEKISASNFVSVMTDQPFARWIINSALVAIFPTVLCVLRARPALRVFSLLVFPPP